MKSDSQTDTINIQDSPIAHNSRRTFPVFWMLAGILLLIFVICIVAVANHQTPQPMVWLEPAKLAQTLRPGKLTLLKYKFLRLPGPWRWFNSRKQHILVESPVMALSSEAAAQTHLPGPCRTNAGMRAWILSSEDLKQFRKHLKTLPGASVESSMHMTTYDGGQIAASSGNTVPIGSTLTFCGLEINLLPRVAKKTFDLLVGVTWTEPIHSANGMISGVQTNVAAACRVFLPNGGGLVLDAGKGLQANGTNYWLIVSSVAVDAKGNPTKL